MELITEKEGHWTGEHYRMRKGGEEGERKKKEEGWGERKEGLEGRGEWKEGKRDEREGEKRKSLGEGEKVSELKYTFGSYTQEVR